MNITEITKLAGPDKRRKRLGRGESSGKGKTCGRGNKGAGQRAGAGIRGLQEGGQMPTFRRMPKRGFSNAKFTTRYAVVNVGDLEENFEPGTHVTAQVLLEARLIRNRRAPVKVLGEGELTKKLRVDAARFSATAAEKIQRAGGQIKETR